MENEFAGKVAIVSGAGQGIGLQIVKQLLEGGACVVMGHRNTERGTKHAEELGDKCDYVRLDVSQEDSWENIFAFAMQKYGHVDILVNNAGITGASADVEHEDIDDWTKVFNVNALGTFLGVKHGMINMTNGGSIVNVNSMAGIYAEPVAVAYSASKGAGRMITKSAALYGAKKEHQVRVNSVHPGATYTEMVREISELQPEVMDAQKAKVPLGDFAQPEDIANMVCYLASDRAQYITGGEFMVDGGISAGF